ncbi:uncharacterized protein LOC132196791 [Neocloeon triangulifer]|uniref:uncharacterized protein LOC132196791 n=1 Tax=Neocloeon triangulifer TaxID=2078957 RepID=UPI00286EC9BB|nr:uncharacterized protein LOC132196791 [Neocloeon triangulifer]
MGRPSRGKRALADKTNVRRKSTEENPKKACVYSSKLSPEKRKEDTDVYQFEFDSQEEPRGKIKKKRVRTKNPAVKRLKASAKIGVKGKKSPKNNAVSHSIKPPPKNLLANIVRSMPLIRPNFPAHVPAALRKDHQTIDKAIVAPPKLLPVRPLQPTPESSPSLPAVTSTPMRLDNINDFVPPSPQHSFTDRPITPPLENLFDDDVPLVVSTQRPTRFDYQELADARARVIRTSLTPRNVVPEPVVFNRDPSPEPPRMKQTSILSFVTSPNEGLFSCSSPVRLTSPEPCSMFSPTKDGDLDLTNVEVGDEEEEEELIEKVEKQKRVESPACAPTRISARALKEVLEANKETLAKEMPLSPKRHFNRPARKSYDRFSKKKALDFMELEHEHDCESDRENLSNSEAESEEEIEEKKKLKPKKKRVDAKTKAFEEWASKFNKELEDYEEFDLAVE